nr:MAG TPA: hypothetical protein [Caudoviricetes sp.]
MNAKFISKIVLLSVVSCNENKYRQYYLEDNVNKDYDLSRYDVYDDSIYKYNSKIYYHYWIALTIGSIK